MCFLKSGLLITRNIFYKGQREIETSLSLSKIRDCHCCIDDVIASLLLNKAPKIETSVPYKGVPYKKYFVYPLMMRWMHNNLTETPKRSKTKYPSCKKKAPVGENCSGSNDMLVTLLEKPN